jgi:hypothetical protein
MTERTQRIIDLIYKSAKKAADPDLTGTDVQKLQGDTQKMIKKTFKEFVEAVVSKYDAKQVEDKWDADPSRDTTLRAGETYGSERVQKALEAAKKRKRGETEENNRRAREDSSSSGQGILGYYRDPETGEVKRGRKKDGKITWIT